MKKASSEKVNVKAKLRRIPEFKGVVFWDITPILKDKRLFRESIRQIADHFRDKKIDVVVSNEARGFIIGAPLAYELGVVGLRVPVRVRMDDGVIIETTCGRIIFNDILPEGAGFVNERLGRKELEKVIAAAIESVGVRRAAQYLDRIKNIGFMYSTVSGVSLAVSDALPPLEKGRIVKEAEEEVARIEGEFEDGLLTDAERRDRVIEAWTVARDEIGKLSPERLRADKGNSIYAIINSKARGSWSQLNQMVGMRGLVSNPQNEVIDFTQAESTGQSATESAADKRNFGIEIDNLTFALDFSANSVITQVNILHPSR